MSDQDLKPCPFCGHVGLSFEDGSTYRWGLASCAACGATAGEVRRNYPPDEAWHKDAIAQWNTRATTAQQASQATAVGDEKPAAWIRWEWNRTGGKSLEFVKPDELSLADEARGVVYDPLYGRPLAPLSERAILDLVPSTMPIANDFDLLWFARAVERAHRIGSHVPVQHKERA